MRERFYQIQISRFPDQCPLLVQKLAGKMQSEGNLDLSTQYGTSVRSQLSECNVMYMYY